MQVSQTTTTTYNQTTTNSNKLTATTSFLNSLIDKAVSPTEIKYEEYKKLTIEDIESLYPKEENSEQYKKAIALHKKVNSSDDEILNQVLFDRELNSNTKAQDIANNMVNVLIDFKIDIEKFEKAIEMANEYMKQNNIPFSMKKFASINAQMMEKLSDYKEESKITAEELFKSFEDQKESYNQNQDYYKSSTNEYYQNAQEIFNYYDGIKAEYKAKKEENRALLDNYTKKSRPNFLENI